MEHIEIVPLSVERTEDYLAFFETGMAAASGEWGYRCYCVSFCSKDNRSEQGFENADVRREGAIRYIKEGVLTGYLAYADGQVVGWCNANDRNACLGCYGMHIYCGAATLAADSERVKSVFCFEIVPSMRRKGIATALLRRVMKDAKAAGYACVEAYPEKQAVGDAENYSGPKDFYEKMGFEAWGETETHLIMRKRL